MKTQLKKYTQKLNVALFAASTAIVAHPELANYVPAKYWGYIALASILISSVLGSLKQRGVSREA